MKELFSNSNPAIPAKVKMEQKKARYSYNLAKKGIRHERLKDWSKNRTTRIVAKSTKGLGKTIAKEAGKTARAVSRNVAEAQIAKSENLSRVLNQQQGLASGLSSALNQEVVRGQNDSSTTTGSAPKNTSMNYENRLGDNR